MTGRIHILAVANWPLGGIRTYMKYVYRYIPREEYHITIYASDTPEREALMRDSAENGVDVVISSSGKSLSVKDIFRLLRGRPVDVIQSHGFISAFYAAIANTLLGKPHIVTIHGIVEERYLSGALGGVKRKLLEHTLKSADVLYGVGSDILEDLQREFPSLLRAPPRRVVIPNGIDATLFSSAPRGDPPEGNCGDHLTPTRIGFMGRFVPQKGFDLLIEATSRLKNDARIRGRFVIAAYGSGDFIKTHQDAIAGKSLGDLIRIYPFERDVIGVYRGLDALVMPSRWEALPLVPMEAMCMGIPVLASDCLGLREVIAETPAVKFRSEDVGSLADALIRFLEQEDRIRGAFADFRGEAARRFDVRRTSSCVEQLFRELAASQPADARSVTSST